MAKNPTYHAQTKHTNVQYHFVREMVKDNKMLLEKVDTLKNVANSLMKSLDTEKFFGSMESMGIAAPSN